MEKCEQCGNSSNHWFVIERDGQRHLFDSFECAIVAMMPACSHCGGRIAEHGLETDMSPHHGDLEDSEMFCCRRCAEAHREAMTACA